MLKPSITRILLLCALALPFAGCVRDNDFFSTDMSESNRKQLVKIVSDGDITIVSRDANPVQDEFNLIELRREPNSENELNQPLTVKLAMKPELLPQGYEALPAAGYQIIGGTDVTFQPGEFVKNVAIKLDKSKLDLSKKYGIAFGIDNAGSGVASQEAGTAVYEVGIKNEWHAEYQATGVFTHPTAGARPIDEKKNLQTVGPRSVRAPLGDLGSANYYMILTVNADNSVTVTPSGITPNIDQSWGRNYYDPATKTFHLHYSYNTAAPRVITESLVRL